MAEHVEHVDEWELRALFNEGGYAKRVEQGEMWELVATQSHPSPQRSGEPLCTMSQLVYYFDGSSKVAEVHRYLRRDGTIGGCGHPDPKALLRGGVLYLLVGRPRGPAAP